MKTWNWLIGAVVFLAIGLSAFMPVSYHRVVTEGVDSFATHAPLFGDRVQKQRVSIGRDIVEVGALLVNLRKAEVLTSVAVTVKDDGGNTLATGTILPTAIADDTFAWAQLSQPIPQAVGNITIELTAPQATAASPIGLRFDTEGEKTLAVGVGESMFLYERLAIWYHDHDVAALRLIYMAWGAALAAVIGLVFSFVPASHQRFVWAAGLMCLALFALWLRWPILQQIDGVFGGDAYNHILKTRAWIQGDDPFASDFRKGPFYSVLLLPGLLTSDPLLWGRLITLTSSVIAVVLVAVLARALSLPPALALSAGVLLAVMREFQFESVHALSNVTFAALVLGTCMLFTQAMHTRRAYWLAVLGGLTALTRYEGVLVPAVLLPAVWIWHRFRIRFVLYTLLPFCVLLTIPLLLWPITGQVGVRTPGDIAGDTGLNVAFSVYEWKQNVLQLKSNLGLQWFFTSTVGRQLYVLAIGYVIGIFLAVCRRKLPRTSSVIGLLPYAGLVWVVGLVIRDFHDTVKLLTLTLTFLVGVGGGHISLANLKYGLPIVLMVVTQAVAVTMILPKIRYYIHLVPFLVLGVALAVGATVLVKKRWSMVGALLFMGALTGVVFLDAQEALPGMIADYNGKAQESALMAKAAKIIREQGGRVGLMTDDLSFRVYLGDEAFEVYPRELQRENLPADEIKQWAEKEGLMFIVEASFNPLFSAIEKQPDVFPQVARFESQDKETRVTVYQFRK